MSKPLPRFSHDPIRDQAKIERVTNARCRDDDIIVAWQSSGMPAANANSPRVPIPRLLRGEIIERDRATCYLCGLKCMPHEIHIDHVTPVAKGGDNHPTNLRVTCRTCNLRKSDSMPDDPPRIAIRIQRTIDRSCKPRQPQDVAIENERRRRRRNG